MSHGIHNLRPRVKMNTEEFLKLCIKTHGNKYDYSKVNYLGDKKNINVKCNTCDHEFTPIAGLHKRGSGCPNCARLKRKITKESFIERSKAKHDSFYDYSKVNFKTPDIKVKIICPIHGEFNQTPNMHMNSGHGCPKCGFERSASSTRFTKEEFIVKAKEIHGNKYDYSKVNYINTMTKVLIICKEHGEFEQTPSSHINQKYGCNQCGYNESFKKLTTTTEEFINKAKKVHGDKYDYSKTIYGKSNKEPLIVICKEHGEFRTIPNNHLTALSGCPACNETKGEFKVAKFLEKNNLEYIREYKIKGYRYRYDFYIPKLNLLIEYDGGLHFKAVKHFGGKEALEKTIKRDKAKNKLAKINNMYLIRIHYLKLNSLEDHLAKKIDELYRYRVNNNYYENFLVLAKALSLPKHTTMTDMRIYRTYEQLDKSV